MTAWNKDKSLPGEVLSSEELSILLDSFPETATGVRDRAIVALTAGTGLRSFETLALRENDVDLKRLSIRIICGKGGKAACVGLAKQMAPYVEAWLRIRPKGAGLLFTTRNGRKVHTSHFRRIMKKVDLGHRVHPHALRHGLACRMAEAGKNLELIKRQLRHSNLNTTATYLQRFHAGNVTAAVEGLQL